MCRSFHCLRFYGCDMPACHCRTTKITGRYIFRGQYIINTQQQNRLSKLEMGTSGCLVNLEKSYLMGLGDWLERVWCYASCFVSKSTKPQIKHSVLNIPGAQITTDTELFLTQKFHVGYTLHRWNAVLSVSSSCFHNSADGAIFFSLWPIIEQQRKPWRNQCEQWKPRLLFF